MSAHSPFAPSSAARWVNCPASIAMARKYPDVCADPDAAEEGIAAHWVCSERLNGRDVPAGTIAPNGVETTDEMAEGADLYEDDVVGTLGGLPMHVEQPVAVPSVHPECWGTPDVWAAGGSMLYLWDYKFGHKPVDPFENWQLTAYASGILDRLGVTGLGDQHTRVVFRIVQPRSYHRDGPVREWSCMASDLRAAINRLHHSAHDKYQTFHVGPECGYCPGRHACTALQFSTMRDADFAAQDVPPVDLAPEAAALELRLLQAAAARIQARVTGLEAQVLSTLRSGVAVPGYRVEFGSGRERWERPVEEVLALGSMLGVDLAKPPAAITPVQARKAGIPAEVVAAYAARPTGAARLTPDDGSLARRIFAHGIDGTVNSK